MFLGFLLLMVVVLVRRIFEERRMLVLATEQAIFCVDSHNSNVTACTYEDEVEVGPPLVDDAVFSKDGDASNKVAELEISLRAF